MPRRGFTLVETLVTLGFVTVLVALALPSLFRSRESARALRCLAQMNGHATMVQAYAHEHRDMLPWAFRYDGRRGPALFFGVTEDEQVNKLLGVDALWHAKVIDWYGRDPAHATLYCPSLRVTESLREEIRAGSKLGPDGRLMTLDYRVSTAFYVDPLALRPDAPALSPRAFAGQRLGDVVFPSNKALLVEGRNLHDVRFDPASKSGTPRPRACHVVSVAGDGRLRESEAAVPGVPPIRVEPGPMRDAVADSVKWLLAPDGVRGRDW